MKYKRIILILFCIVGVFVITISFKANQNNFTEISPSKNDLDPHNYYEELIENCQEMEELSVSCCLESVEHMKAANYFLMGEKSCPEGYKPNLLRCIGSFKWCEPL